MYNATLFINTGFNAVNIPDKPSLLAQAQSVTVPALDIYQARELSSFVVKSSYASIKNADYLYLSNPNDAADFAYYSIQNITMTSMDTAVLSVTMDYILTAGGSTGVSSLSFTDGICERHHVAQNEDVFGAFTEEDPFISPAETMIIEPEKPDFIEQGLSPLVANRSAIIMEATVDLFKMKDKDLLIALQFDKIVDPITGTVTTVDGVDVPAMIGLEQTFVNQTVSMLKEDDSSGYSSQDHYQASAPAVQYTIANADSLPFRELSGSTVQVDVDWLPDALSTVRGLGVDSAIIAQYAVPFYMVESTNFALRGTGQQAKYTGDVSSLIGSCRVISSTLPFTPASYPNNIMNKRLLYGENCKYHIISLASGNEASFLPEEIYESNSSSPRIVLRVDPRATGCPYFRFATYRNVSCVPNEQNADPDSFFINAVKGLEWQNVPLIYQGASGSLLNQYKFEASRAVKDESMLHDTLTYGYNSFANKFNLGTNIAGGVLTAVGAAITGRTGLAGASVGGMVSDYGDYLMNAEKLAIDRDHAVKSFAIEKGAEMQALLINNQVVAPTMNFPISEGIRDFVGNECLVYRTIYTPNDVLRIDKILTMYGYKHTTPIENSFLTNRSKFNYIQAAGVQINNLNIPKWLREGVAAQFATGLRIWHVLPDPAIYTNGTNI